MLLDVLLWRQTCTTQLLFSLSVPPRIIGSKEEEVSVIEGHMVSLLCDVQAYPPPEITWTRDGQVLHFSTGIHILPGQTSATRITLFLCQEHFLFESNNGTEITFHIISYIYYRRPDATVAPGETGRCRAICMHSHQLSRPGPEEYSPQCLWWANTWWPICTIQLHIQMIKSQNIV